MKCPTGHVAVCDYVLQRGSLRKGRVGWWGGGGGRLEREMGMGEKDYTSVFVIPDFRSRRENHQPSTLHVIRPYV